MSSLANPKNNSCLPDRQACRVDVLKSSLILFFVFLVSFCSFVHAQNDDTSMELNGDTVEYSVDGNKVIARGNVIIKYNKATLYCDEVEVSRATQIADARGNVRLVTEQGEISGDTITFDFQNMTGEFNNAKIYADPYYGAGRKVAKVGENELVMYDGYVTTSDFDKPEYRFTSKRIEVFPGDKLVARGIQPRFGNVPLMYIPKFTQSLADTKPKFLFTPGYDKEWGTFLLTQWRYYLNENLKGTIHLDYRERLDFASGFDVDYDTKKFGKGILRTYYMNERKISSKHPWEEKPTPTVERERFKVELRHKWQIDENTDAIGQYYRLSDGDLLKDYFENEYEEDSSPETFFLLTRTLPKGTLSFRTDVRVNRFEDRVERLPEIRYDLPNEELGDSNVFLKTTTTVSNLTHKHPSPTEVREETFRVDTDNEVSYPMKVGFLEFTPFVGSEHTYYSKTLDPDEYDSIRAVFKAGGSVSTKFYKIYDAYFDQWGLEIDRLRHVLTPSIAHRYVTQPTIDAGQLDQFDSIDALDNSHYVTLSLENKLQTKRNGTSIDLLRAIIETDYELKENPGDLGFNTIRMDTDFRPSDYLTLYFDTQYDTRNDHLDTANFDFYVHDKDKWHVGVGKRFNREVDDQLTTEYYYKFNPKWAFTVFHRYNLETGQLREQNYVLRRDLHTWLMDLSIQDKLDGATEFVVIFTLKAFPDLGLDFGTALNRRKSGSDQ